LDSVLDSDFRNPLFDWLLGGRRYTNV